MTTASVGAFVAQSQPRFNRDLQAFVRIPSVSSDPAHNADVKRCAAWLATQLKSAGLTQVRIISTKRHPLVFAQWNSAPHKPTVLIYGHYDVQPAEPLSEWKIPPFAAVIRDGHCHGRGASDDKGQLLAHVKAIEAILQTAGRLPVNVKCVFEGEEEIGSTNLLPFLSRNRAALIADAAVMSDTRMLGPDQPALTYALRGQLALELMVVGAAHDLHSGNFGGAVHDPLQVMCEIVARLHDSDGRIAIPGFYDRVRSWSQAERAYLRRSGPSDEAVLKEAGALASWGEHGYSIYERLTLRPSLAVTGLSGGHGGAGPKGVIPSRATAKLSFRLVPDQDPVEIEQLVRRFICTMVPRTVNATLRTDIRSRPALIDRSHPAMRAAAVAYSTVFGRTPTWIRSGGSIPVVSEIQRVLGTPTVLMGFASPGDGLHGPNEKFSVRNFNRAILTSAAFLESFGRSASAPRIEPLLSARRT